MANHKRENQLDMEQILVAYCPDGTDQGFATGPLVDGSTNLGIGNGQLGVLSYDFRGTPKLGEFLTAGTSPDAVRAIKILQGTPASDNLGISDPWEVGHKPYVETGIIHRDYVRSVTFQKCRPKCLSNNGVADVCDPCDNTEYGFFTALNSARLTKTSGYNGLRVSGAFETPCYTALGTASPKDHMLQNVISDYNRSSGMVSTPFGGTYGSAPTLAFAINTAGGAGVPIGSITCGTEIPIEKTIYESCHVTCGTEPNTSVVKADLPMVLSLACLVAKQEMAAGCGKVVAPITAASTIECIDLTTAGDADNVDAFVVLGLCEDLANGIDTVPQRTTNVKVTLQKGLRKCGNITCCPPDEGVGWGRNWKIQNDMRWQRHIHNMYASIDDGGLSQAEGQRYFDPNKTYSSLIIDYWDHEETLTLQEQSPKQAIILFCCSWECTDVATAAPIMVANAEAKDANARVDVVITNEIACCPVCDPNIPAATLAADTAAILINWFKECDADFNNGIDFDDDYWKGGPSALFGAAGL